MLAAQGRTSFLTLLLAFAFAFVAAFRFGTGMFIGCETRAAPNQRSPRELDSAAWPHHDITVSNNSIMHAARQA